MKLKRDWGFTLVELLVVISIIGLLSGLALPAISSARKSGSKAVSAGNLRNLGLAISSYVADNDGYLPGATSCLTGVSPFAKGSSQNSLQVKLITYLEKEFKPSGANWTFYTKCLAYPAWVTFNKGTNDNSSPPYILCQDYPATAGAVFSPFGGGTGGGNELKMTQAQEVIGSLTNKPYAVIETDQQLYQKITWNNPSWKKIFHKIPSMEKCGMFCISTGMSRRLLQTSLFPGKRRFRSNSCKTRFPPSSIRPPQEKSDLLYFGYLLR